MNMKISLDPGEHTQNPGRLKVMVFNQLTACQIKNFTIKSTATSFIERIEKQAFNLTESIFLQDLGTNVWNV